MFYQQVILLREIFQKNDYSENFTVRCFKLFLNRIHILKEKALTVEKKPLQLVHPHSRGTERGTERCIQRGTELL